LPTAAASKPTRDPRELLEKWAREDTLDVVLPVISAKIAPATSVPAKIYAAKRPEKTKPATPVPPVTVAAPTDRPSFEPLPLSITARVGQGVAYFGVAVLSVGAGLVLLDYFGNQTGLAPYGWLATLAGQLLMFLGVVTLISAGLEQSGAETARQLTSLSDQLLRLEHAVQTQPARRGAPVEEESSPGEVDFGVTPEKSARARIRKSA